MQYRNFGKLDWKVSVLGFGAMRLPLTDQDQSHINEPEAIRMIRYAIDNGVNYLDSAYLYHGGQSERLVAKALKDGYHSKMKVATKLPARMVETAKDFDRIFNEQLQKLEFDKMDFYLLHGLNAEGWHKVRDLGIIPWMEDKLAKGLIEHMGFSFHDNYDVLKEIIDAYDHWTLCQLQYNYMDVNEQAGSRGVSYAAEKGLAVVVMEPLRGGMLAKTPPKKVAEIFDKFPRKRSYTEWALMWLWDQLEVSVALSGMSTMEQVVENIALASRSYPGMLTMDEKALISRVRDAYRGMRPVACTGCKYCMPCPNGVEIPNVFQIYNDSVIYEDLKTGQFRYNSPYSLTQDHRADKCVECGECTVKCPQQIPIPEELKKAHAALYQETPPSR
jgi:uncharacterized protein